MTDSHIVAMMVVVALVAFSGLKHLYLSKYY